VSTGTSTATARAGAVTVEIVQLIEPESIEVIEGSKDPWQGWVSYERGTQIAAPVVVTRRTGDRVTFLTVIVATGAEGEADARLVERPDGGHSVAVSVEGRDAVVDIGDGGELTLLP
jgi:hypothetical protein